MGRSIMISNVWPALLGMLCARRLARCLALQCVVSTVLQHAAYAVSSCLLPAGNTSLLRQVFQRAVPWEAKPLAAVGSSSGTHPILIPYTA